MPTGCWGWCSDDPHSTPLPGGCTAPPPLEPAQMLQPPQATDPVSRSVPVKPGLSTPCTAQQLTQMQAAVPLPELLCHPQQQHLEHWGTNPQRGSGGSGCILMGLSVTAKHLQPGSTWSHQTILARGSLSTASHHPGHPQFISHCSPKPKPVPSSASRKQHAKQKCFRTWIEHPGNDNSHVHKYVFRKAALYSIGRQRGNSHAS